jgi:hypothetical protein
MVDGFASNRFQLHTWTLAQFCASAPYTLVAALVLQLVFHWLAGLNDRSEAFMYAVLLNLVQQWIQDAIDWNVVEALKNAMLSVTFVMVVLGSLFLFSGFFIQVGSQACATRGRV